MCIKVDNKIECVECGYPYHEAKYPDNYDEPLSCNCTQQDVDNHITFVEGLKKDVHSWDCKCIIHR